MTAPVTASVAASVTAVDMLQAVPLASLKGA
jgi:hypothetical protein